MSVFQSDMNNEFKRYATFSSFRSPEGVTVWPTQLARAGFYRSANCPEFQVVCFSCGLMLDVRLLIKEPVMDTHRRSSPTCSFVTGSSDNQPVNPVNTSTASFEWLSLNFSFDSSPDALPSLQEAGSNHHENFHSNSHGSNEIRPDTHELPENLSLSHIVSQLPSLTDLNTLEDPGGLSTVPIELINGFANTTLSSVQSMAQLFSFDAESLSPFDFGSSAPREILVTDGVEDGVEGMYPPRAMPESEISSYAGNAQQPAYVGELGESDVTHKLTFSDLGIVTDRPKRPDLARLQQRLNTFDNWNGPEISQSRDSLAEAGLYYSGNQDCCRCFYCGGGLKSWDRDDDPWVEHARWFKDCPFLLTNMGKEFITAVHSLDAAHANNISMFDARREMNRIKSAMCKPDNCQTDVEMEETPIADDDNIENEAERLSDENQNLRQPDLCKICLDSEVSIVYVPCGHLVTCGACAPTVKNCPVCRLAIGGQIRIQRNGD